MLLEYSGSFMIRNNLRIRGQGHFSKISEYERPRRDFERFTACLDNTKEDSVNSHPLFWYFHVSSNLAHFQEGKSLDIGMAPDVLPSITAQLATFPSQNSCARKIKVGSLRSIWSRRFWNNVTFTDYRSEGSDSPWGGIYLIFLIFPVVNGSEHPEKTFFAVETSPHN